MKIEEFALERIQSLYENRVELNLSDSGVHPLSLDELLSVKELAELRSLELGYGWTNGAVSLRETVAALYENRGPDDVIVTNGSSEANFLMVMSLLDPGDEIVVFTPNYLQIWGWARALGVTVKTVAHKEELDWAPDLDELKSLVTPKTRLVTICHPNNPTGMVLDPDAMAELVAVAADNGIYLHADEIYKGSELVGPEPPSFLDLYDRAIVTNGLSKAMALPGLRIGWLAGPAQDIYAAWQRKDYTSITTSALSEYVAERVLKPGLRRRILDRSKRILRENLSLLSDWVSGNSNYFGFVPPKAGGMAFVRYAQEVNSTELVDALRVEKGLLLLPGDVYGLDGYFRVGIGGPRRQLEQGLERISDYFLENAPSTAASEKD
ncbi:MAG: aminotransferase class I/II-fold pyridoxal phosphate-dependent enzyme [Gammaproteobacteria bacterium]|nr:aminotransferase class I/II-fold pyridoxal phosphate-dependent enzyme [Gammaproteobacteria bacterium]